jgi:hypothetical protein
LALKRPVGTRRIRRFIRVSALLTTIGLVRLAHWAWIRWQPLAAGSALTVAGIMLRHGLWSLMSLAGLWLLAYALLIPARRKRHSELARQLAAYSTPAQRCDLEATLDRYPDSVTRELREVLTGQAMATGRGGIPGAGR